MTPTPLTIVTGASRGLGLALAEQLLARGHRVLAISRRSPVLSTPAEGLTHWAADLADPAPVAERLAAWLATLSTPDLGPATLINNAGVIAAPAPLAAQGADGLANALRVGLEAPLLLTAAFLRATAAWPVPRKVLLISSGLGRRAMAGQAAYCAAKAGLDHLARAVALEEAGRPHGARIVSLAPGVIDTDMQQQLRTADAALFPERERFVALQAGGLLDRPAEAAAKVLRMLDRADFGSQPVADVREAA
ncbi:MAG: SDR family NAD(P)-dependent oxidoreductase [Burkholderiales bacterium]|nr:SDR family NAD(P)-dependent oxidoreductase [Burkholderiales bacterium]MDE2277599.1 SDR family NAD(P)-dependent oxidoreductase [Burkholderiales bacterium]